LSHRDIQREPLRGWRGWLVVDTSDGPTLASWCVSALWPARQALEARCGMHGSSGWGRAVSHTRGWRSEFAYPYDLQLLAGDRALARALAGRYGVEVSPVEAEL
jgi:hypothetical protein